VNDLSLLLALLSFLAGVIVLRAIAAVTGGMTFDSWGAAFGAVLIAYAVGLGAAYVMRFPVQSAFDSVTAFMVTNAVLQLTVNLVSLAVAGALLSGVHIKGVLGLLTASIALTVVNVAMTYVPLVMPAM
jgi:hypothetical protein